MSPDVAVAPKVSRKQSAWHEDQLWPQSSEAQVGGTPPKPSMGYNPWLLASQVMGPNSGGVRGYGTKIHGFYQDLIIL